MLAISALCGGRLLILTDAASTPASKLMYDTKTACTIRCRLLRFREFSESLQFTEINSFLTER